MVLRRVIIGTAQEQGVYRRGRLHTGTFATPDMQEPIRIIIRGKSTPIVDP